MTTTNHTQTIFIFGICSDIGREIALRFIGQGWRVVGTYRNEVGLGGLSERDGVTVMPCDADDPHSIAAAVAEFAALDMPWDMFLSSIGTMEPIGPFFDLDIDAWETSIIVNSTAQMRMLHGLYPLRRQGGVTHAGFFAGAGTNGVTPNYSAYVTAKVMLIKMCEQLDSEVSDLNVFVLGPGFIPTKIIQQTLRAGQRAGANYQKTLDFLKTSGTSLDDVFAHINWCMEQGREVAGGRNFSTVHDPWREDNRNLAEQLRDDSDMFRLRRYASDSTK